MSTPFIDIDGYIGPGAYSKTYVKNFLADYKGKNVIANISSLGGDFNHGLSIHDQFAAHKNTTADLTGFIASSATVAAMGCKHVKASINSFFLIHQVMSWVDAWGYMNEDELKDVITELEKEKKDNEKMTLCAARIYANKTGKPLADIHDLMKQEIWLTAEEAKEWGFIDEVYEPAEKVDLFKDSKAMSMMKANGFPTPIQKNKGGSTEETPTADQIAETVLDKIKNLFPTKTNSKNKTEMKKYDFINTLLKVDSLESSDEKGVYLNAAQLASINDKLKEDKEAVTNLATANTELDSLHPDVKKAADVKAKMAVVREKLAAKPGAKPTGSAAKGGDEGNEGDGVDHETLNALPHMQQLDDIL